MTRLNLFFMFIYALVISALHYTVHTEDKLMEEFKEVIHLHETPLDKEEVEEKEAKERKSKGVYRCNEDELTKGSIVLFNIQS